MRIVQLSKVFSRTGGVGAYVLRLCRALEDAGHEVILIHGDPNAEKNVMRGKTFYIPDFHLYNHESNFAKTSEILEILAPLKPDVIHVQNNNNLELESEIQKIYPALKSIHVYDYCPSGNKFHHATGKACEHATSAKCLPRMIYKRCTTAKNPSWMLNAYKQTMAVNAMNQRYAKVLVASEYVKNEAVRSGYALSQVEVLNYFAEEVKAEEFDSLETQTIMFSGRVFREKGIFRLLKVIKKIPETLNFEVVIDGDGPALERAKKIVQNSPNQSKVKFVGWLNEEDHKRLFAKSSLVVFPSIWPEPFGLVGIEAMSYGKPVVAFDQAGVKEWLRNGVSGYAVPVNDEKAMADKIKFLIENRSHATAMGAEGREIFEREFTARVHSKKLHAIYKDVRRTFSRSAQHVG